MVSLYIVMNSKDNVATALADLDKGQTIQLASGPITLAKKVPLGHKFAIKSIKCDEDVVKYGQVIGKAKRDIDPGDWVHRNLRSPYLEER